MTSLFFSSTSSKKGWRIKKDEGRRLYFKASDSPLSNFFACQLCIDEIVYHSAEQAYQHQKVLGNGRKDLVRGILECSTPWGCKALTRFGVCKSWESEKVRVMREILLHKYQQCEEFRSVLVNTEDVILIEDTCDVFWGRGVDGMGLNMLGVVLARVRLEGKRMNRS